MASIMAKVFIIILAGQVILILIIVAILKQILDRQLTESAIHHVETMYSNAVDPNLGELDIITYNGLNEIYQKRLIDTLYRKINKTVKLNIKKDKAIKGGIIIQLKDKPIDNSILSRLKEGGMIKG